MEQTRLLQVQELSFSCLCFIYAWTVHNRRLSSIAALTLLRPILDQRRAIVPRRADWQSHHIETSHKTTDHWRQSLFNYPVPNQAKFILLQQSGTLQGQIGHLHLPIQRLGFVS